MPIPTVIYVPTHGLPSYFRTVSAGLGERDSVMQHAERPLTYEGVSSDRWNEGASKKRTSLPPTCPSRSRYIQVVDASLSDSDSSISLHFFPASGNPSGSLELRESLSFSISSSAAVFKVNQSEQAHAKAA